MNRINESLFRFLAMKPFLIRKFFLFILCLGVVNLGFAQTSFTSLQKNITRVGNAFNNKENLLKKEFEEKGLEWPAKYIYIRSFKFDAQLEIWVKNDLKDKYKLFKTYRVCLQSGTMGPKRMQGDYQVPEGFYYITEFNPRSAYHLSLGLNYPNPSDKILSDPVRPGNSIFIHGSCVSEGCIPVSDADIEEVYILAAYAYEAGQEYIPVHIFPIRYNNKKSVEYFQNFCKNNPDLIPFSSQLERAYEQFEKTHQVPAILIDPKGEYIVGN